MYSTLAMLNPGASFSIEEMEELIAEPCEVMSAELLRTETGILIEVEGEQFHIRLEQGDDVRSESKEIAARYRLPCAESSQRFSIWADDDPEMEIFNLWLILVERLGATGKFVLFDPEKGEEVSISS